MLVVWNIAVLVRTVANSCRCEALKSSQSVVEKCSSEKIYFFRSASVRRKDEQGLLSTRRAKQVCIKEC